MERWLEEWPRKATSTRRTYAAAIKRFAAEFGPTPLGEVECLSARSWALTVPRGISRVVAIMYEDARNVGVVENNPFSNLCLPVSERAEEITAPTLDEYRELLNATTVLGGYGPEFRAMIQFASWTGVRAGELQALRWEDVGPDTIRVRGARKRDGTIGPPEEWEDPRDLVLASGAGAGGRSPAPRSVRLPFTHGQCAGPGLSPLLLAHRLGGCGLAAGALA